MVKIIAKIMETRFYKLPCGMSPLILSMLLVISSSGLLSCEQQPQSMFERQANTDSAIDIVDNDDTNNDDNPNPAVAVVASVTPVTPSDSKNSNSATRIQANKQQAVARQPNCRSLQARCQYFELNILEFSPAQPWLTSIMWQTIARALAPETPLAGQDEIAKRTVSILFSQIEYGTKAVESLPMYQRIDTELVLNPAVGDPSIDSPDTAYLTVRANQHRSDSRQQQVTYVMLDMQKKLQLTIEDILLPEVSTNELLLTFQTAKKEWLALQDVEQQYHEDWPLHLSRQWYLDQQGLHMVYQSGELLTAKTGAVDLMVPYALLQELIKPRYIVQPPIDSKL